MPNPQNITFHPNRVFVKELPLDIERDELMDAFSGFGLRIRAVRVVETNGATNYGFLTFESKEEADEAIQRAKSDRGILVRGRKVGVDHAFSRRTPPRKNSRQFSQAFQGLYRSMNPEIGTGMETPRHHFSHENYNCQFAMNETPNQRCASPANQIHYSPPTSQHYNNYCFDGRSMYVAPPNPAMTGQQQAAGFNQNGHMAFQHGAVHDERSNAHWPVVTGHHGAYDVEHPHQRFGTVHPSFVTPHHPGLNTQMYVGNPAEGTEAPDVPEWSTHTESATVQRADSGPPTGYHHHNHDLNLQNQSQLHHQTQLLHHHLAQQQNSLNPQWIQYATIPYPPSPRKNSDCSSN